MLTCKHGVVHVNVMSPQWCGRTMIRVVDLGSPESCSCHRGTDPAVQSAEFLRKRHRDTKQWSTNCFTEIIAEHLHHWWLISAFPDMFFFSVTRSIVSWTPTELNWECSGRHWLNYRMNPSEFRRTLVVGKPASDPDLIGESTNIPVLYQQSQTACDNY